MIKNHYLRPVWVVLVIGLIGFAVRQIVVPADFGIGERGFMYGFHRLGNEDEWKQFKVKYLTKQYCKDCHVDNYEKNMLSKHKIIQCENCHGPAVEHPVDPPKLAINRERSLCLRCHAKLPYPTSKRGDIKGINPEEHYPDMECVTCHNPHMPDLGG